MNQRTENAAVTDLLRAIVEALDVPLPSLADADERAYHRLLAHRTSDLRVTLAVLLSRGGDPWENASIIRRRTAEEPVTYAPFVFTEDDGGTS
ncbi:hypothetical protein [Streptomyces sp. TBY4]|uniref:hypothetical protein n=1 Tax=Streptomyces sp. TBY4 TaxID=2962030 RepID=UPI0020B72194|nr:hypothetical protein [Streptomyces sp. TBY4]MCP3758732.1 hypothetical protein [Streptomyces sp. TBY4]